MNAAHFVQKDHVRDTIKSFTEIQNETKIQYLEIEARSNEARNQVGSSDSEAKWLWNHLWNSAAGSTELLIL